LDKRFNADAIPDVAGGFLNRLQHSYNFFARYVERWGPGDAPPEASRPLVDRWILGRLDRVVAEVRSAWSGYDVTTGARAIISFCDNDLSNWYVRLNRPRFWAPDSDPDAAAAATLFEVLVTVSRLLAPAAPFTADVIHRRLTGTSVHLAPFPEPAARGRADPAIDGAMEAVRTLASLARAAREAAGIRVRQPLGQMRVTVPASVARPALDALLPLLAEEVNVKDVTVVASDEQLVRLKARPNFASLGKVHGRQTPAAAEAARGLRRDQLRALEAGETVTARTAGGEQFTYRPEDVGIEREVVTDWLVQSAGPYVAALDPALSDELRHEGVAREVVNRVQRLRKAAGYDYTTRIALSISGADEVLAAARAHRTFIAGETLARRFETGRNLPKPDLSERVEIDGREVVISLKRHDGTAKRRSPATRKKKRNRNTA